MPREPALWTAAVDAVYSEQPCVRAGWLHTTCRILCSARCRIIHTGVCSTLGALGKLRCIVHIVGGDDVTPCDVHRVIDSYHLLQSAS